MPPSLGFQLLGQPTSDLVEDQTYKRFGAADVRRRHDEVEGGRGLPFYEVADAPVASAGHRRHDRIAIETKKRHRGRKDAGSLIVALVQKLAGRTRDHRMHTPFA